MAEKFQIITYYEFKPLDDPARIRGEIESAMRAHRILGTVILAREGFNSTVCGRPDDIRAYVAEAGRILGTTLRCKSSFHDAAPFRKVHVRVKPEIVTLRREVDIAAGEGTHVPPREWNEIIARDDVFLLDTRNDYEFKVGTFRNAVNPGTEKFSDLPEFVARNLDPERHKHVAMFCTGGIRCEKFAPYMKQLGFANVYQLEGGILRYLEEVSDVDSLWDGECYIFDRRVTVDENLRPGSAPDLSVGSSSSGSGGGGGNGGAGSDSK